MARARNIKPGFYKNEDLAECSIWARYIFPGLWMLADREGRLEDRPKRIKAELLPFDGGDMNKLLQELHDRGFLVRYENMDGRFIQISKFSEHQSPHYSEKPSAIKPPELPENNATIDQEKPESTPGVLLENTRYPQVTVRGPQLPDCLNPDSLIADSPNPSSPNPDSPNPDNVNPVAPGSTTTSARRKREKSDAKTGPIWTAYAGAFEQRYGTPPVRNARVNGQLANFVTRLPEAEAPHVAAFYLTSNRGLYVSARHCVDLLVRDAESLRTQWATNHRTTETEARQADRTQANGNAFQQLIDEAEAREAAAHNR